MCPIRHADGVFRHLGTDDTEFAAELACCLACANGAAQPPWWLVCVDCIDYADRAHDDEE